ncbi:hypothetical protein LCGC14_0457930 [marine sediment metagenome]|uniref:Nucleoside 2-deoxyribosyltransferase n=1 Tax=marine sediment metagenome TaxID=412755 RepID=A0A0F9SFY1_9ZZZZ
MSRPKVYLAGPIKGLNYAEATDWRVEARRLLAQQGLDGFSPMRAKHFLKGSLSISTDEFYDNVIATPQAIVTRDRYDIRTCDMMLINVQGATTASLGTAIEIGWADSWRKPIVIVGIDTPLPCFDCERVGCGYYSPNPSPFKHEFIEALVGYKVETVEQAVQVCRNVLFSDETVRGGDPQ